MDASGAVFVADLNNYRVQKCTLSANDYACTTFAGETGVFGDDFGHFIPVAVAVDQDGRVYRGRCVELPYPGLRRQRRLSCYYRRPLGAGSGYMIAPRGVAVDQFGNLYVAEYDNHRLQKFSLRRARMGSG